MAQMPRHQLDPDLLLARLEDVLIRLERTTEALNDLFDRRARRLGLVEGGPPDGGTQEKAGRGDR